MKTLYIFLTRSGTLLSNLVYHLTGAQYTHVSLAFDEDLSTLYSSTRKNGYTMFPAGLLAAHPVAAPAALFLLPVCQRGAGKERGGGPAQGQHPDAPQ